MLGWIVAYPLACSPALIKPAFSPVANYICELWGLRTMATRQPHQLGKLLTSHVHILRGIVELRKSTLHTLVVSESAYDPLSGSRLQQSLTLWNQLAELPLTSFYARWNA